jgi:hypothetical protein
MMKLEDWKGGCINGHLPNELKVVSIVVDNPKLRGKLLKLPIKILVLLPKKQYIATLQCIKCGERITQLISPDKKE